MVIPHEQGTRGMTTRSPFDELRVRWLFVQFVLVAGPALWLASRVGDARGLGLSEGNEERLGFVLMDCTLGLLLVVRGQLARLGWRGLFGHWPTRTELPLLAGVVPVNLVGMGLSMAVFIPLSYVWPWVIEGWLLADGPLMDAQSFADWLGVVFMSSVVTPVIEELFFRGFLFHRWARRWGTWRAAVASSALFGILHGDMIGAFLFGVAMCALYARTRTLWMPIIAHALSNFAVDLFSLSDVLRHAPPARDTLESLRGEWPFGVAALVAGALLLAWYLRRYWQGDALRAALTGPVPYDRYAASATSAPDSTSAS